MASQESLLIAERRPLADEALLPIYDELANDVDTSSLLLPENETVQREKEAFYASGGDYVPDLRPRNIDNDRLAAKERQLAARKGSLADFEVDDELKLAYRWRINEALANIRMVRASSAGDMRRFAAYNSFIYGRPDKEVFNAVVDEFCSTAEATIDSQDPTRVAAAEKVLALLDGQRGDRRLLIPPQEVFEAVRDDHFREKGFYALLLAGVELPEKGPIKPEVGDPALRQVLNNLESDYALEDAPAAAWSVSHSRKAALRPASYSMPLNRFIGLGAGHEIGSHLLERQNGLRGPIRLNAIGLDRYEAGNEGRAVIREQVPYKSFAEFSQLPRWQDIMRRHLATSLAEGLSGKMMNFPEVYKHINAIDMLYEKNKAPEDPAAAEQRAHNRTWALLQLVFKGTDGTGGSYRRYMVYLEGNIACWKEAARDPARIGLGDLGKFDITNPRHISVLQKHGVLPSGE